MTTPNFEDLLKSQTNFVQSVQQQFAQLAGLQPPTPEEMVKMKEAKLERLKQALSLVEAEAREYQAQITQLEQELQHDRAILEQESHSS